MKKWIKALKLAELQQNPNLFVHKGKRFVVCKLEDGVYALDDCCSHAEASLAEGDLEDEVLICPLHGARFDARTGKNLSFPAVTPVEAFAVKIEADEVFIEIDDSEE